MARSEEALTFFVLLLPMATPCYTIVKNNCQISSLFLIAPSSCRPGATQAATDDSSIQPSLKPSPSDEISQATSSRLYISLSPLIDVGTQRWRGTHHGRACGLAYQKVFRHLCCNTISFRCLRLK